MAALTLSILLLALKGKHLPFLIKGGMNSKDFLFILVQLKVREPKNDLH